MQHQIDIAEAKAHLAELLDEAIQGNEILITRDDQPLVKLSPVVTEPLTLSPQEKARLWREWAASHSHDTPLLSDEAISRESIYGEHG